MTKNTYDFSALVGETIVAIDHNAYDDRVVFTLADGREALMYHSQDCCESVRLEEVIGDWDDIIGSPILLAEEVTSDDDLPSGHDDLAQWTFYKLATVKGHITLRWFGESNGYYSVDVSFRMPLASADTHPKGGDVQQAPATLSGAVAASETPNASSNTYSSSPPKEQR